MEHAALLLPYINTPHTTGLSPNLPWPLITMQLTGGPASRGGWRGCGGHGRAAQQPRGQRVVCSAGVEPPTSRTARLPRRGALLGGGVALSYGMHPELALAAAYKAPPARNERMQFERLDNGLRVLVLREGALKGKKPSVGDEVSPPTPNATLPLSQRASICWSISGTQTVRGKGAVSRSFFMYPRPSHTLPASPQSPLVSPALTTRWRRGGRWRSTTTAGWLRNKAGGSTLRTTTWIASARPSPFPSPWETRE